MISIINTKCQQDFDWNNKVFYNNVYIISLIKDLFCGSKYHMTLVYCVYSLEVEKSNLSICKSY